MTAYTTKMIVRNTDTHRIIEISEIITYETNKTSSRSAEKQRKGKEKEKKRKGKGKGKEKKRKGKEKERKRKGKGKKRKGKGKKRERKPRRRGREGREFDTTGASVVCLHHYQVAACSHQARLPCLSPLI